MVSKRSRDVRTQLHIWNKLLEGRIAVQKVVTAVRDLEKLNGQDETEDQVEAADESTVKSINKLLTCLIRLRDTYRIKSQFSVEADSQSQVYGDENGPIPLDEVDQILTNKHVEYNKIRDDTIEKWCAKTKIGTIPKKGYVAMELPTLQLISNAIKDKDRLIRRTQLDRTSHVDNMYNNETEMSR